MNELNNLILGLPVGVAFGFAIDSWSTSMSKLSALIHNSGDVFMLPSVLSLRFCLLGP